MTARAWLRHPAATIRPPRCPTSLERFPTRKAAELAIHTYDPYTTATPCPHPKCGGWHHTQRPPHQPAAADCEPNWRDQPAELDRLCEDGARRLYGPRVAARDVNTIDLQGSYL